MSFGWWGKVKIKGSKCPCNSALGKQKHVDLEFQVILGYIPDKSFSFQDRTCFQLVCVCVCVLPFWSAWSLKR